MRMELLLLVAGAAALPALSPPPLALLTGEAEGSLEITCFAPRSYSGSTFELFAVGSDVPVQSIAAEAGQHRAHFTLHGASPCYRCRYRSYNGSTWQTSAFSTEIAVNDSSGTGCHLPTTSTPTGTGYPLPTSTTLRQDRSWLLPVVVSVAVLVLVLLVAAAVVAWRVAARRRQAKRQQPSCWTETQCPTTELCYDNCSYNIGLNTQPGAGDVPGTSPVSPSTVAPYFSTFRSLA